MIRIISSILFSLVLLSDANASEKKQCTQEEAFQAESEANTLKDWDSVYRSFRRFEHCDDGAISEGYSDTIGRQLAHDWEHFLRLNEICSSDKRFERFILKHVNSTMRANVWEIIINNTRLRCPSKAERLCKVIEARLVKIAAEAQGKPNMK